MSPVNYEQNFDLLNDGPLSGQDGFTGTGWIVQTAVKFAGAKAIYCLTTGDVQRTFSGTNNEIHWMKTVIRSSDISQIHPAVYVGKGLFDQATIVSPLSGYMQAYNGNGVGGGVWFSTGVALQNGQWYVVKKKINFATKKWDVYVSAAGGIGGMLIPKLTDLNFRYDSCDSLNWIRFYQSTVLAKYIDEFMIHNYDPDVGKNLLSQGFNTNLLLSGRLN